MVSTAPYLSVRLRPLQAMELVGRCANREPKCHPQEAVFFFWRDPFRAYSTQHTAHIVFITTCPVFHQNPQTQDILLPFVLDPRFPPDTFFLLAEGDFRFYEKDCLGEVGDRWPEIGAPQVAERLQRAVAAGGVGVAMGPPTSRGTDAAPSSVAGSSTDAPGRQLKRPELVFAPGGPPQSQRTGSQEAGTDLLAVLQTTTATRSSQAPPTAMPVAQPESQAPPVLLPESQTPPCLQPPDDAETKSLSCDSGRTFFGFAADMPDCWPSQELLDIVHIATHADRVDKGNFIWYAYEAGTKGGTKQQPMHGLSLVGFTKVFAQAFLEHLRSTDPAHVDIVLQRWLLGGAQHAVGASFVFPSCGSFEAHFSGCQKGLGVRPSTWQKPWIGQGFRCAKGHRYLGQWSQAGGPSWGRPLQLDMGGLQWKTERPPVSWRDPRWRDRLWARWWLDYNYEWVGPAWADEADPDARERSRRHTEAPRGGASGSRGQGGRQSQAPAAPPGLKGRVKQGFSELRTDPDGFRTRGGGQPSPITRLAEMLVTAPASEDTRFCALGTARVDRARRKYVENYCRRIFVDSGEDRKHRQSTNAQ